MLYTSILGFITVNGGNGHDVIHALGANQTLMGGASDDLLGYAAGSTDFVGASAALNGDSLYNWTTSDVIDITDMNDNTLQPLAYSNGKLTVKDGTHTVTLTVNGSSLTLQNFVAVGSDGNGGTLIDYHS